METSSRNPLPGPHAGDWKVLQGPRDTTKGERGRESAASALNGTMGAWCISQDVGRPPPSQEGQVLPTLCALHCRFQDPGIIHGSAFRTQLYPANRRVLAVIWL